MNAGPPTTRVIAIKLLDEPENALRVAMDDGKMLELVNDIRDNGLYYPLIVEPVGKRFEVLDGHRRLLACRELGLTHVPCIVRVEGASPPEAVKLKTNLLREENTDAEIAVWLGELATKHGYTLTELSETVGRSEDWVNSRTDLLRGDADVLQALADRKVNFSQAQVLNRCKDKRWRDLGLHYAVSDHVPAGRLNEWLTRNSSIVIGVVPAKAEPVAEPADGAGQHAGIVCEYCGGWKDPQNMVQLWLHRSEWFIVQQILNVQREQETAAEPQLPQ